MSPDHPARVRPIHDELFSLTRSWALRHRIDMERVRTLRRQAFLLNHDHYRETIPFYRRVAEGEGIDRIDDVETIKNRLMLSVDLFKSYDQKWLDQGNYAAMNAWLSDISQRRIETDVTGVRSIDEWLDRLAADGGPRLVYSSGTSGTFSFLPRDTATWELSGTAGVCTLVPMLAARVGTFWQRMLVRIVCRFTSPATFQKLARRGSSKDFDAVFLDFRNGRTGTQTLSRELSSGFRRHCFLYDTDLPASVVRLATRGPRNAEECDNLRRLQQTVQTNRDANYLRVGEALMQSTRDGQKVFIFGATYQFKELCEVLADRYGTVPLRPDSLVLFGGGWKSFRGERLSRPRLVSLISQTFGLAPQRILEAYSMSEINAVLLQCASGRFHLPPFIEPVILDERLVPRAGRDVRGLFGYLDPLAMGYPGFLVSGDEVHLVEGDCPCGLTGPAVLEIGRARGQEVKGCGGAVTSVTA